MVAGLQMWTPVGSPYGALESRAPELSAATLFGHEHLVSVLGQRTRILDIGSGPVIICSSGVASAIPDWVLLIEELVADHRIIVFDRPGDPSGDELLTGRVSLETEAARLIGVLDACGVTGPVTAVGHSMGAYIVESALRYFPQRFRVGISLDGSTLSEAESARGFSPDRRSRILRRTARSEMLSRAWSLLSSRAMLAFAVGRVKVLSRFSLMALHYAQRGFLLGSIREFIDFDDCADQLERLRSQRRLDPQLVLGAFPAAGLLPVKRSGRWIGEVFAEARTLASECAVVVAIVRYASHFIMLDQPAAAAALIRRVEGTAAGRADIDWNEGAWSGADWDESVWRDVGQQ